MGTNNDNVPNFGVTSDNNALNLANFNNKSGNEILLSPLSTSYSRSSQQSKSKVFKRQAVHLIRFCLKSGINENKDIIEFLRANNIFLKNRTFDRYKSFAEKELDNYLEADIWLSEKVQNALVPDYKDISDRYDKQLVLDDILMGSLIKQAVDKAIKLDNDADKYYNYLDFSEMIKIQAISNYTMKNKLELISKGFMVYKIKQHIDYLRGTVKSKGKQNNIQKKRNRY